MKNRKNEINYKKIYLVGFTFHNKIITSYHDLKKNMNIIKNILKGKKTLFCLVNFKLLLFICSNIICIYSY